METSLIEVKAAINAILYGSVGAMVLIWLGAGAIAVRRYFGD